jgi:hypothetical protein
MEVRPLGSGVMGPELADPGAPSSANLPQNGLAQLKLLRCLGDGNKTYEGLNLPSYVVTK